MYVNAVPAVEALGFLWKLHHAVAANLEGVYQVVPALQWVNIVSTPSAASYRALSSSVTSGTDVPLLPQK